MKFKSFYSEIVEQDDLRRIDYNCFGQAIAECKLPEKSSIMKVFISYARKDESLAEKVAGALEAAGLDAWFGKYEIIPGENWAEKIAQGLRESDAMVVLLTPDALESDLVRMDIEYALGEKSYSNRLITVFFGNPEDLLAHKVPWILNHLKTVKILKYENNEEQLKQITDAVKEVA